MEVIPAIDLIDGKCVRLTRGNYRRRTTYTDLPLPRARAFKTAGARTIHVIDLDGARTGTAANLDVAESVKRETDLRIEFGGGIRSAEAVAEVLDRRKLDRVILGTAAFAGPSFLSQATKQFGERVMVAVDVKDGRIAINGWRAEADMTVQEAIEFVANAGVREIVYTDTERDGTLEGPRTEALFAVLTAAKARAVAVQFAGGIADLADVKRLRDFEGKGLKAVVAGKALYEGTLDLAEAIQAAR